ncbi:MAG: hypothetical protein JW939_01070 [Candidatus Thermoplasmatota archaeon]|nr:hypothetical protein [Candidatus Thermoplasmatota archaeon]
MSTMKRRAMAITLTMALFAVAFAGLFFVEGAENPTTLSVTVTEGPIYAGDDVVFNLTGWGYEWDIAADFTVELKLNEVVTGTPTYNTDHDYFEWVWTAVAGDHDWMVMVTNNTDSAEWNTTGTFHVFAYPEFIGTSAVAMEEDVPLEWNLSAEFSGEGLTFAEEAAPENLTFAKGEGEYAIWTVTPAAEWSGTEDVKVFATDVNGMEVNNTYTFTVSAVNDDPIIIGIEYKDTTYTVVERTIETEWNETSGEAINWTTVEVIDLPIMEDEMEVNFTVNATDVETAKDELTYEIAEGDYYTLALMNESIPCWFHFIGDENMFGIWEAVLTVSDGANVVTETLWFNVTGVNDAPTIMFDTIEMGDQLDVEPLEAVNVSVSVDDIDSEELTIMWYIDEVEVEDWNMDYFLYNWSDEGIYNITVWVTDGDLTSDLLYFWVNVTEPAPTWTADDVVVNYTEGSGDVVVADIGGLVPPYTYSNLRLAADYQGIDITAIATALEDTELVVTITFAGAPYTLSLADMVDGNYKVPEYRLYFVKSTFTETKFNQASPDMDFEPAEADVYSIGFLWDYLDATDATITGNDMVFRIALSDLDDAGITKDDFNLFFVATLEDHGGTLLAPTLKAGYDSAGKSAVVHLIPVVDDDDVVDDDEEEDSWLWLIILIIVIVIVIAIILIVVFMMKGKKEEEPEAPLEEEMPPPEEGEMPTEETEVPPEEGEFPMEGSEEPPVEPEMPAPEEPVPEEPIPETPMPPQ